MRKLYIVSLPIGNILDITIHAIEVLKQVDYILCEDTREFIKIASQYNISTRCVSYHIFNEHEIKKHINHLKKGSIALTCDRGTPTINDPGFELIRQARLLDNNIIEVIPGPSAITAACIFNHFNYRYCFIGFTNTLEEYKYISLPCIYFISRYKIKTFLQECLSVFGNREVVLCRELTKIHQEVVCFDLNNIPDREFLGEITLIISGYVSESQNIDTHIEAIKKHTQISNKDLSFIISHFCNISKNIVYKKIKHN